MKCRPSCKAHSPTAGAVSRLQDRKGLTKGAEQSKSKSSGIPTGIAKSASLNSLYTNAESGHSYESMQNTTMTPLMQVKETLTGEVRRTESPRSNLSSPSHTSTKVQLSTCIDLGNISTLYGRQCTRVQEEGLPLRGTHYRSKGTAL